MNDDTFSRNEARMEEFHRVPHRASAQFADRENADRVVEQIANVQNLSPLVPINGEALDDHIASMANLIQRQRDTLRDRFVAEIAEDDAKHVASVDAVCALTRRVEQLERELADLRAAQSLAAPTGAHPYRSAAQNATAGPGCLVAASEAAPTSASASGVWRRVYGALRPFAVTGAVGWAIGFVYMSASAPDSVAFRVQVFAMLVGSLAGLAGTLVLAWRVARAVRAGALP